jgi:hypothetical protein
MSSYIKYDKSHDKRWESTLPSNIPIRDLKTDEKLQRMIVRERCQRIPSPIYYTILCIVERLRQFSTSSIENFASTTIVVF